MIHTLFHSSPLDSIAPSNVHYTTAVFLILLETCYKLQKVRSTGYVKWMWESIWHTDTQCTYRVKVTLAEQHSKFVLTYYTSHDKQIEPDVLHLQRDIYADIRVCNLTHRRILNYILHSEQLRNPFRRLLEFEYHAFYSIVLIHDL